MFTTLPQMKQMSLKSTALHYNVHTYFLLKAAEDEIPYTDTCTSNNVREEEKY